MKFPFFTSSRDPTGIHDTLYHVTHAKAGSSWLYRIFKKAHKDRVPVRVGKKIDTIKHQEGQIYSALFCGYEDFVQVPTSLETPHFFVMRDLRDTLTSLYFSHRYSHIPNPKVAKAREILTDMNEDEGMLYMFKTHSEELMRIQRSWIESPAPVYTYEALFESEGMLLLDILDDIGFNYKRKPLKSIIKKSTFEKAFGRKPGEVDIHSHGRSGVAGSWKKHRNPELDQFIEENLSEHLRFSGYEV
ncbi:MAG: sulfotransferase domain-containing protein [Opitutaceae bacterium]